MPELTKRTCTGVMICGLYKHLSNTLHRLHTRLQPTSADCCTPYAGITEPDLLPPVNMECASILEICMSIEVVPLEHVICDPCRVLKLPPNRSNTLIVPGVNITHILLTPNHQANLLL